MDMEHDISSEMTSLVRPMIVTQCYELNTQRWGGYKWEIGEDEAALVYWLHSGGCSACSGIWTFCLPPLVNLCNSTPLWPGQ